MISRRRAIIAATAVAIAAVAAVQLARVDADVGATFGAERGMRLLDASSFAPAHRIDIAREVLATRPIDGRAYRAIAVAQAGNAPPSRTLLDIANARWPRDLITRAHLTDRALAEGDVETGLSNLDAMLRIAPGTRPELLPLLMPHLADARVRDALVDRLAANPPWKTAFFAALRSSAAPAAEADALLVALDARQPLDEDGVRTRIVLLDRAGRHAQARAAWRALLPEAARVENAAVFDGGFEFPDIRGGYGWHFDALPDVSIDHDTHAPHAGASSLSIDFGGRPQAFAGLSQSLALAPGRYRFSAWVRDEVERERPFEWRIVCRNGTKLARIPFERSEGGADWHRIDAEFDVPEQCPGQTLVLAHAARFLAERHLRGRLMIDDVGIFLTGAHALREHGRAMLSHDRNIVI